MNTPAVRCSTPRTSGGVCVVAPAAPWSYRDGVFLPPCTWSDWADAPDGTRCAECATCPDRQWVEAGTVEIRGRTVAHTARVRVGDKTGPVHRRLRRAAAVSAAEADGVHLRDALCLRVQHQAARTGGRWEAGRWCVHCGGDCVTGTHAADCPNLTGVYRVTPFMVAGGQRCSRCESDLVIGDTFHRVRVTEQSSMWPQLVAIAEQNGVDPSEAQMVSFEVVCMGCAAAEAGLGIG